MGSFLSVSTIRVNASQNTSNLSINSSIKSSTPILKNISVGTAPKGIFYDQDNNFLYVANYASKSISIINVTTNTVSKIINTSANCWKFAYDPANQFLYVSNDFANYITVVNTRTNAIIGNITTGVHGYDVLVVYDNYNNLLYVGSNQDNYLLAINTTTNLVVASIPIGNGVGNSAIAIDNNNFIYLAVHLSDTINIVNGYTNKVVKTAIVGNAPGATLYDPYNGYVYITLAGYAFAPEHSLLVYNPVTEKVIKNITIGAFPSALYYDAQYHAIFELNIQNSSIGVINDTTNELISLYQIGSAPTGITIPSNHQNIYITITGDNKIVYTNLESFISSLRQNPVNITSSSLNFVDLPLFTVSFIVLVFITLKKKSH